MDFRLKQFSKLKVLPRPEDSLRALVDRAPQAEAFAERSFERLRPAGNWFYRSRRRLATAAVILVTAWLSLHVLFGANGMVVYQQKSAEYQDLGKQVKLLQDENDRYTSQIKDLKTNPETMVREAREQLHYTRPGEVVYVAPAPVRPQPPTNSAAHK
jgi:cell division protein FtsB